MSDAPVGRPTKLTPERLEIAKAYVYPEEKPSKLPTVERLARHLGVSRSTVYKWAGENEAFSDIIEALLAEQADELINKGLTGKFNPTITKLLLSGKHGYVEKSEIDQNLKGDIVWVNDVPRPKLEDE